MAGLDNGVWREQRGTAAVEFVLTAGLLILILFGMVELGLMVNSRLVLEAAAREGARRAAIEGGATDGAFAAVRRELTAGGISPDKVAVDIRPHQASYGTTINLDLDYAYPVTTPVMRSLLGPSLPLSAAAVTRSEKLSAHDR